VKTKTFLLGLVATGIAVGVAPLAAQVVEQPWHLSGQVGTYYLDDARDTRNDDVWWQVGFGRFFGDHFSLDLEYDEFSGTYRQADLISPGTSNDQWNLEHLGLMGRYHFTQGKFRPYVAFGTGLLKESNLVGSDRNHTLRLGVGLQGQLAKHWSARAQLLWQHDSGSREVSTEGKFQDYILSIGLNFDFGGKPPPPPPAPVKEEPPPPPPPNPDLDGDGVLNERDKCPNTRPGAVVDLDGCEVEAVIELDGVNFDFDKATLRPEAMVVLDEAAALLEKHERVVIEVAGHTDSVGSEEYNQGLSERRANAVRDYLTSKGVKASRLTARGYGESMPIASNDTDEGRAENRRVEMIVLDR
jgi:OOP family OmpA-OmpF porin